MHRLCRTLRAYVLGLSVLQPFLCCTVLPSAFLVTQRAAPSADVITNPSSRADVHMYMRRWFFAAAAAAAATTENQGQSQPACVLAARLLQHGFPSTGGSPGSNWPSFSCTCICITNYFCSLTDKGSFSLCDLTTTGSPPDQIQWCAQRVEV